MQENPELPLSQVEMQQCIQDCLDCHAVCMQTAEACRQAGGEHAHDEHVYMLLDCADMCLTAAHFMQVGMAWQARSGLKPQKIWRWVYDGNRSQWLPSKRTMRASKQQEKGLFMLFSNA